MKLGDRLMASNSERQRTSGPQERTKSGFMYCRKFTLRAAQNLAKEFREAKILLTEFEVITDWRVVGSNCPVSKDAFMSAFKA